MAMNEDGEETVFLVQVPTDFFATYCMDNSFYEVYEVNEEVVTICFRDEKITDAFVRVYSQFNWYSIAIHLRHAEQIAVWDEDYVKYRYGLDMMFG